MHARTRSRRHSLVLLLATLVIAGIQTPGAAAMTDAGAAPPVAVDDVLSVRSGFDTSFNVLANDSDPDGDSISLTAPTPGVAVPTGHGSVICQPWGDCSYTPEAGYLGPDGFDYTVRDGNGEADVGQVSLTVTLNTPPVAVDDVAEAVGGYPAFLDLVTNDTDADIGDQLVIVAPEPGVPTDTPHGTITCSEFWCEYVADPGYVGTDEFDYSIADQSEATDQGHVTVTVVANPPPVAEDDSFARADTAVLKVLRPRSRT